MDAALQKAKKVELRVTEAQKEVLSRAAALHHASLSEFVRMTALEAAERLLGEQSRFGMSHKEWQAFCKELDRPPRELPRLKKFMKKLSAFGG